MNSAATGSIDEADVQEWMNIYSNKPGHTALTEEEIIHVVSRSDKEEANKLIANKLAIPPTVRLTHACQPLTLPGQYSYSADYNYAVS